MSEDQVRQQAIAKALEHYLSFDKSGGLRKMTINQIANATVMAHNNISLYFPPKKGSSRTKITTPNPETLEKLLCALDVPRAVFDQKVGEIEAEKKKETPQSSADEPRTMQVDNEAGLLEEDGFLTDAMLLQYYEKEVLNKRVLELLGENLPLTIPAEVDRIFNQKEQTSLTLIPSTEPYSLTIPEKIKSTLDEAVESHQRRREELNKQGITMAHYNSQNLRFSNVEETQDKKINIVLRPVWYKEHHMTNMILDYKSQLPQSCSLREIIHTNNEMPTPWTEVSLANHVGVSMLLLSYEGWLIIPQRSKRQGNSPELNGPSISGALSAKHLPLPISLDQFQPWGEADEELALSSDQITLKQYLGTYVELKRAKPEMSWIAQTSLQFKEIRQRWEDARDRDEAMALHLWDLGVYDWGNLTSCSSEQMETLHKRLKYYLSKGKASLSLKGSLALWMKHLTQNAQES